jgi:CRP-like cAMP-binding protein
MHNAIALLSELSQSDTDWIFDNGVIQKVNADDVIIEQGKHPDAIYFVLEGVVGIY